MKRRALAWLGVLTLCIVLACAANATRSLSLTSDEVRSAISDVDDRSIFPLLATHIGRDVELAAADHVDIATTTKAMATELSDGQVIVSSISLGLSQASSQIMPGLPGASEPRTTMTFWGMTVTEPVSEPTPIIPGLGSAPVFNPGVISSAQDHSSLLQTTLHSPTDTLLPLMSEPNRPTSNIIGGQPIISTFLPFGTMTVTPAGVVTPSSHQATAFPVPGKQSTKANVSTVNASTKSTAMVLGGATATNPLSVGLPASSQETGTLLGEPASLNTASESQLLVTTTFSFWGTTIVTAWHPKPSISSAASLIQSSGGLVTPSHTNGVFSESQPLITTTFSFWGTTIVTAWHQKASISSALTLIQSSGGSVTSSHTNGVLTHKSGVSTMTGTRSLSISALPKSFATSGILAPATTGTKPTCGTRTMTDSTIGTDDMAAGTLWCNPPCNLIIPNYPLKTPTVITPSPLTTAITHQIESGTNSGSNVVLTTTITPAPLTISTASFLAQPITDCNSTLGVLIPQAIIAPEPSPWRTSITDGPVITTSLIIPPYQPPASTCSHYSDCPSPPIIVHVCGPDGCGDKGSSGGGGGCGIHCGGCPFPTILSFLCDPLTLLGLIPKPPCIGPLCYPWPPCVPPTAGCWIKFPELVDPNVPSNKNKNPTITPSNWNNHHPETKCLQGSTVTDVVISCFTQGSTSFCENTTSYTVSGCDITANTSTTLLACPVLDPDEPQGDTSMPASVSAELSSLLSGANFPGGVPHPKKTSKTTSKAATDTAGWLPVDSAISALWSEAAGNNPAPTPTGDGDIPVSSVLSALWAEISHDHPVPKPDFSTCLECEGILGASSCPASDEKCLEDECNSAHACVFCPTIYCNQVWFALPTQVVAAKTADGFGPLTQSVRPH